MWCPPSATALASARRAGAPGEDGQAELKGTDMEHREHRAELVDVIRRIRHRWRLRLATRGAVVVFVGMAAVLLLSASSLETFKFSVPAIIGFRLLALGVLAA